MKNLTLKNLPFFIHRSLFQLPKLLAKACRVGGLLIILLAAGLTSIRAQDTWTQKADFGGLAKPVSGFSIANKAYVGTGKDCGNIVEKYFWEYDPATDVWTQKADFGGGARYAAVGFSIGNIGYFGTGAASDFNYTKDFWAYDPTTNIWTRKADFGGDIRFLAVGFSIGTKGYIGTGINYPGGWNYLKDFWEYDPVTDTWTQKADFGGGIRGHALGFSIGNKGYLGTGLNNKSFYKDFWEYDPATDMWAQKANVGGSTRSDAACFSIGNKGYIGTGLDNNGAVLKDFWEYDVSADSWTQKADFAGHARMSALGLGIGDKGYIGTGSSANCGQFYKDFWEYTPGTGPSCTIPSRQTTANITGSSAKLLWDPVSNALGYKVRYKAAGTSDWIIISKIKSHTIVINGLTPNTLYYWEVKSGCTKDPIDASDWSAKQSFTTSAFRLVDEQAVSLDLYPNPVVQTFTLDLQLNSSTDQSATILLLNALGQVIYSEKIIAANGELKKEITMPSSASSGWYIVRVVTSDQVMEKKLIYQK